MCYMVLDDWGWQCVTWCWMTGGGSVLHGVG